MAEHDVPVGRRHGELKEYAVGAEDSVIDDLDETDLLVGREGRSLGARLIQDTRPLPRQQAGRREPGRQKQRGRQEYPPHLTTASFLITVADWFSVPPRILTMTL